MAVRSVDIHKCIGCGTCVESCPMDVFRLDTIVEKRPECSPCSLACPLGLNQRTYHNLIKLHMLDDAAEILRMSHPMPSITGRICPHPCEADCFRGAVDEPININGLEQYLGERLLNTSPQSPSTVRKDKVAVIGSGPAGLSTAYFLALYGYGVTVFEKERKPGGLLRSAIPSFRLSEEILDRQIDCYEKMGIAFKTGVIFGKDITRETLAENGFAVFVAATGASKPMALAVPGANAEGITSAMAFLEDVKSSRMVQMDGKVAVIGGGSVALDAARSAVRLGAEEVHVICLECLEPGLKDSMLALQREIEDAKAEGIVIHPSRGVDAFTTENGCVSGITCVGCRSVRDEDGRFNPIYDDCTAPLEIEADAVILAIGQTADPTLVPDGFKTNSQGYIVADDLGKQPDAGLFAVGDAVSGPSTVVEALASGKRAALTIDHYLQGADRSAGLTDKFPKAEGPPKEREIYKAGREHRRMAADSDRLNHFNETVLPLSWRQAYMESERCLTCGSRSMIAYLDDCQVCRLCQHYCPTDAIDITEGQALGSLHAFNVVNLG